MPNPDGSLDLLLQADPPAAGQAVNWLPVDRDRPFQLALRRYRPRAAAPDGRWIPPPVQRVD